MQDLLFCCVMFERTLFDSYCAQCDAAIGNENICNGSECGKR